MSETEERLPLDLLRHDHAVIITERFGFAITTPHGYPAAVKAAFTGEELTPEQEEFRQADLPPIPAGALCVCGERWRWDPDGRDAQTASSRRGRKPTLDITRDGDDECARAGRR